MEPYEKLKDLPESEQAKCFVKFLEFHKLATDGSNDLENNSNKELNYLSSIINSIAKEQSTSSGSPKKNQKTLDSWLIKPKTPRKNEIGKSPIASERPSGVESSSATNDIPASLDSTRSNLNNENSLSPSKTDENCLKGLDCSPSKCDKLLNSCSVKVVRISLPEESNSTTKNKRKYTKSSSSSNKSTKGIVQSHVTNNSDAGLDVSEHNIDVPLKVFKKILNSDSSNVSESPNSILSESNNSSDETILNSSKFNENNSQNTEHLPCKSGIITKKGKKNYTKSSSSNKSIKEIVQSHITNNSNADLDVSECNVDVPLKVSKKILNSDSSNVSESLNSTLSESNNSSDETTLNSSKFNKNNSQNTENMPCKSGEEGNNFTKDLQISQSEDSELTGVVIRKGNSMLKRKYTELSQPLGTETSTKTSIFTDNIMPDASLENTFSEPNYQANNSDNQDVDKVSPFIKGTRNLRSRKVTINLPKIIRSNIKPQQNVEKNVDISEKTSSPKKGKCVDSSLLYNRHREAFKILEKECSSININLVDILQNASVQDVLNDPDFLDNNAQFIINSLKLSNDTTVPAVYVVHSSKEFSEIVKKGRKSL